MNKETNLRQVFVQMLFALAVSQIALKCGELINLNSYNDLWSSIKELHYVYAHLMLSIVILTTSWVGWQISQSIGNTGKINSIFSIQYIILLIDIFLVISYFVIVRGTEIDTSKHEIQKASIFPEALWSLIIFITYFIWDFITKGITISYTSNKNQTFKRSRKINLKAFFARAWQTLICICLTGSIYCFATADIPIKVTILYPW